ncbi:MAG: UbiD family decarboxylase [Oscillospiraceae bacterium]|nr:UbiD family decarboxylase [Oscillospiraceae bacterium]
MDRQDLRGFLAALPAEDLLRIEAEQTDYLLTALVEELERRRRFPVVALTGETGIHTVANLFASRRRLSSAISNVLTVEQQAERLAQPVLVECAPVFTVSRTGAEVDAGTLPLVRHYEQDAGRYLSSGIVVARDPETGRYNLSFHRMQYKGPRRFGISLHSRGDLWRYFHTAQAKGVDLEIAVVIGAHPVFYLTGATSVPAAFDDYSYAAAYLGEAVELARCRTVDLLVPAGAEYVLEGRILKDVFEDEGPFGEYTGYGTSRSTRNVFQVTALSHRQDPIWLELTPGWSMEHLLLSQYTREILLLHQIQTVMPNVKALNLPKNGCHFHAYVSIDHPLPGQARQLGMLLFGLDHYLKLVVVVDSDIDVFDEERVWWACATRFQAGRDLFQVPGARCNVLDPSSREGMADKLCLDATCPPDFAGSPITLPDGVRTKAKALLDLEVRTVG